MTAGTSAASTRTCAFGPLSIAYDDSVLEPRPWTVLQSEWAAELAASLPPGPMVEFCAGAGQIGLLAGILADRDLIQVEADATAASFARANARAAGREDRVEVRTARIEDALRPDETVDLIIADPPYLPSVQITRWPQDPVTAIDGGTDGLDVVRACLHAAAAHLTPTGHLLMQVAGPAQAARTAQLALDLPTFELRSHAVRSVDDERSVVLLSR